MSEITPQNINSTFVVLDDANNAILIANSDRFYEKLEAYHADPRYAEFCSPEEVTPDFTYQLFQRFIQWATEVPRCNYQLAIVDRRNLELIGCGGLRQDGYAAGQAELGIELAPQHWGRYAYAIEVGKALIDFGFRDLELKEIIGLSVSANLRVSRLAERYGFQAIGTQPGSSWMHMQGWSQIKWQLTRESWEHLFPLTSSVN